jgi:hypothetical protein
VSATPQRRVADRRKAPRRWVKRKVPVSRKERTIMGAIRFMYTFATTAFGFGIVWLVDNFTSLNVPMWVGLLIGSLAYATKRYLKPIGRW